MFEDKIAELKNTLIPYYLLYRESIVRAANGTATDEDKTKLSQLAKTTVHNIPIRELLDTLVSVPDDWIARAGGDSTQNLLLLKKAWQNVGDDIGKGFVGTVTGAVDNVLGKISGFFSGAGDDNNAPTPETTTPTAAQSSGSSSSGGSSSGTGNTSNSQDADFFKSVGSFFSQGFDALADFGTAVKTAFKGSSVEDFAAQSKAFRDAADAIENSDLTPEQRKVAYQNLVQEASERMGMDADGASKFTNFLFNTVKIPTNMVTGAFSNAGDFLKEIFTPHERYNIYEPLTDQAINRYLKPIRDEATAFMDRRQERFGVENLQKFGFSEAQASKFIQYMKNPIVRQLFRASTSQALNQIFGPEEGGALFQKIRGNITGIINGFQGDGNDIFDALSNGMFSQRSIYAMGEAANALTQKPSFETGWARADDYVATISNLQSMGWDPDKYVIRGELTDNTDLLRTYDRLSEKSQGVAKDRFIQEQGIKAMENALKEYNIKQPKSKQLTAVYNADGSLDVNATVASNSDLTTEMQAAKTGAEKNAAAVWDSAFKTDSRSRGTVSDEYSKSISAIVSGQAIADFVQDRTVEEMSVRAIFSNLRGAREALGGKDMDLATAQQLIRTIGGSDVNGNYSDAATNARLYALHMGDAGVDFKRALSAASLVGETAKQVGLNPEMTQQAQLFGAELLSSRMGTLAPGELLDKDRALAVSMQNGVRIMNARAYQDLAWLETARFKDDSNGKKFQAIRDKVRKGQPLGKEDWDLLQNESERQAAFDGDVHEYRASRTGLDITAKNLSSSSQFMVRYAATQKEQETLRDQMRLVTSEQWKNDVNLRADSPYQKDTLRRYYMDLLGTVTMDRAAMLLSGKDTLTLEEEKRLEEAGVDVTSIKDAIAAAGNQDESVREELYTSLRNAGEKEAKAHGYTAQDWDTAHSRPSIQALRRQNVREQLLKEVGPDSGAAFMERVLAGDTKLTGGTIAGRFVTNWLSGGYMNSQDAADQLLADEKAHRAFLMAASTGAKSASEFFQQGFGVNDAGAFASLKKKFQDEHTDDEFDWYREGITPEVAFNHILEVFSDDSEEGKKLQTAYAKLLHGTAYGQALEKVLRAQNKTEKEAALGEMNSAVTGVPEAEAAPTVVEGTPVSANENKQSQSAEGGQSAQIASSIPATNGNYTDDNPLPVRLIERQIQIISDTTTTDGVRMV